MKQTSSRAPSSLSPECKAWFRRMATEYQVNDQGGLTLLTLAAEARDRMKAAQLAIATEGMTSIDKYGRQKAHPLLAIERDARGQMLAALKALHLDVEPLKAVGRPGAG